MTANELIDDIRKFKRQLDYNFIQNDGIEYILWLTEREDYLLADEINTFCFNPNVSQAKSVDGMEMCGIKIKVITVDERDI